MGAAGGKAERDEGTAERRHGGTAEAAAGECGARETNRNDRGEDQDGEDEQGPALGLGRPERRRGPEGGGGAAGEPGLAEGGEEETAGTERPAEEVVGGPARPEGHGAEGVASEPRWR